MILIFNLQGLSRLLSFLTHPFSQTYVDAAGCPFMWWMSNVVDLIFWEKILKFFVLSGSGARYKLSQFLRLNPVCSKLKFMFSMGILFFGLKTTTHGKCDLKIWILEVSFIMWSGFQAKKLNTHWSSKLELAANWAEPKKVSTHLHYQPAEACPLPFRPVSLPPYPFPHLKLEVKLSRKF